VFSSRLVDLDAAVVAIPGKCHGRNLPKVPACLECNGEKSRLEHHLTSVLPFGGIHADAHQALNAAGHRLTRNAPLHRELAQGAGDGTLPFRPEILTDFIALAVRGLLFYHLDARLGPEHGVKVIYQSCFEWDLFFRLNHRGRIENVVFVVVFGSLDGLNELESELVSPMVEALLRIPTRDRGVAAGTCGSRRRVLAEISG
jgi:hypothetical protein